MIVGIDLGTTNSAVAVWRDGQSHLIPNALGEYLTPSAVSIVDGDTILVGAAAKERQSTHPRDTATVFKRYIGTSQTTRLGRMEFGAEDLSALILRSLKDDAEAFLGEPVTGAVITVPAYFNDRQRKATRRAGELAGLKVERLINEPTAAALAFGVHERAEREPFLVFDLGGGTFDVSIVEMFDGIVEVRASAGNNRLGGEDFNDCLIDLARRRIDPDGCLDGADPIALRELLRVSAERARRELSDRDNAVFSLTHDDTVFSATIGSAEFESHAETLMAQLRDPVLRSLRDSGIASEALSEIVLVGGATRMPIVRRAITRMFGRFPNASVHPDHAVALGAAVQAGLLARDAALDEIRLTDICPFTLGVDQAERDMRGNLRYGLFSPIIERNSPIPISRVNYYCTIGDGQSAIQFGIYQGEARDVSANVKLGELKIPVPPRPAGQISVECRFSYDSSGLLEVDVLVPATGLKRNLVIIDDADAMTPDEVERRRESLAALKFHPREDARNAALLARAKRCYEGFIGENRERVGQWITTFEAALDSQDDRLIRDAQAELARVLDALEGERFL
ncbi:Hsp70 family protein [Sphingomonas colocasiae]|uniref:Molecular chaperone HscC n=1 Tax=Sphingomonas colocasiae TaxID=1848973 RepID=A0ABS7PKB4_9SPHN|nr:molecular chaperone HscC [Sphingomonas colocasiae]MBY8821726.1 molecular chaperone HscC [Sphingomonas colocasiae]